MNIRTIAFALSISFIGNIHASKVSDNQFSAKSYIIADQNGEIIEERSGNDIRPIASITKLMVGLLAAEQDLYEELAIPKKRVVQSSIPTNVRLLSRKDLLILSLVKSDNLAAQILCDNIPSCVEKMNDRARIIGMYDTKFFEPTGLSRENVSTAKDLLKLMIELSKNHIVSELSSLPNATIISGKKEIKIRNTNPLTEKLNVLLSKTGFTKPAGGCLVMIIDSNLGNRILIILGSKNTRTRIFDMERLIKNGRIL